jgi:Domain of unknown function (DUF4159)
MKRAWLAFALVVLVASAATAQFGGARQPLRFPTKDTFGHGFNFCRGVYTSGRREAGGQGWSTDYPDAERNFSIRFAELTRTRVSKNYDGEPEFVVVRLTDPALYGCGFLHLEDVGTATLSGPEIEGLRNYLLRGGFVWCDDFWGTFAWNNWMSELRKVLPPAEFPVVPIPKDHPIYRTQFDVEAIPQIPSIQFWRQSGGGTSERGADSARPDFNGIFDERGRLMMVLTHNTDISDAWEREGEDPRFFLNFSPSGYAVGINVILYAMTH